MIMSNKSTINLGVLGGVLNEVWEIENEHHLRMRFGFMIGRLTLEEIDFTRRLIEKYREKKRDFLKF